VATGLLRQDPAPPSPSASAAGSQSAHPRPSTTAGDRGRPAIPVPGASVQPGLRPVRIRIPAIGVDSPLTNIGLQSDGTLEVPQPGRDYDKAAWFTGSPAPGEVGPAVIEGHVDGKVNGPSVFYRLGALKPGNKISVNRKDGSTARFIVNGVQLFAKNSFPTLKVYGNTSGPELRLITCGGFFDSHRAAGGYRSNVVVFAQRA
jgi:sortase (surface protein transpeptidase)